MADVKSEQTMLQAAVGSKRDQVTILGVPVDMVTFDEAIAKIIEFLSNDGHHTVATADASGINIAQTDHEFMQILRRADLVTPDSVGVLWAAKRLGRPIAARVSGVELVDRLCAMSAERGFRIFFLGAAPGVAEMAAEKMRLRHPGCNIVGARHGYFPSSDDELVAAEVAESKPDILFVAMGIPRQEKFLAKCLSITGAKVGMGVGGSFDVFSGTVRRAPKLFQKLNLEWLWRTASNPKKIAKAKNLPVFWWRVIRSGR